MFFIFYLSQYFLDKNFSVCDSYVIPKLCFKRFLSVSRKTGMHLIDEVINFKLM